MSAASSDECPVMTLYGFGLLRKKTSSFSSRVRKSALRTKPPHVLLKISEGKGSQPTPEWYLVFTRLRPSFCRDIAMIVQKATKPIFTQTWCSATWLFLTSHTWSLSSCHTSDSVCIGMPSLVVSLALTKYEIT